MTQKKIILPTVVDTSGPTVTDDKAHGFLVGMLWLTSTTLYVCTSNATGAAVWTEIGSGGGGGGVTSVGLSLPSSIFDVSGSPVTGTGTLTATLDAQVKNKVFVGPITGSDAAPTFRVLDKADIKAALAAALDAGTNVTITDNGDGTFTIDATGGGGGGGDIDWANPVAITTTTTITASGVGKVHDCTGTSADYTVTLPTTGLSIGDVMAFRMGTTTTLTKLVTLDSTSGHLLGGGYGAGVQTRIMHSNEIAVIYWDGFNWRKLYGISIPMEFVAENSAGVSVADNTVVKISLSTIRASNSAMLASGRFYPARPGRYNITAMISYGKVGLIGGNDAYCGIGINSESGFTTAPSKIAVVPFSQNATDSYAHVGLAANDVLLAAGDYVALIGLQTSGGTVATRTVDVVRPNFTAIEIPTW